MYCLGTNYLTIMGWGCRRPSVDYDQWCNGLRTCLKSGRLWIRARQVKPKTIKLAFITSNCM
jgi:hypothetical protein